MYKNSVCIFTEHEWQFVLILTCVQLCISFKKQHFYKNVELFILTLNQELSDPSRVVEK